MKNGKRVSLKNIDIGESGAAMTQNWYDEVSNIAKIFRHPSKILLFKITVYRNTAFLFFQVKDVDNGKRTGATGVIGHYTQVVWAKTYEVGCGFMRSTHPEYGVEDVSIQ